MRYLLRGITFARLLIMFQITRKPSKVRTDRNSSPRKGNSTLGSTSAGSPRKGSSQGFESLSAMSPTGMQNTEVSSTPVSVDLSPLLTGFTPQQENAMFYRLFRDMYYNDAVCGSSVDLMSALPFSEYSLGGVSDRKVLNSYTETLERLSLRSMFPEISVDYLVLGVHCSSLLYSKERKVFIDTMPHAIENMTVRTLPFYSQDPLITVKFPKEIQDIFGKSAGNSGSTRIERLRKLVGDTVIDKIAAGSIELDPLSTLYLPRKTFTNTDAGTSYYRRVLPIYLVEKNLYRGTLLESARRQRGILHLTLGDGDSWEPTIADMEYMTELFMNADSDPLGAIIATRMGVEVNEIRQGGDFWKVTDFADSVLSHKLRALGIGDSFLSGDASYNTADAGLSVFIEQIRSYREMMTRKLFYDKLFPLVALINGYTLNARGKIVIKDNLLDTLSPEEALFTLNDGSRLLIPQVSWAKNLKPEGDSTYMEVLNTLAEKGIPVPLRVLAAAGGLNIEELLRQKEDDLSTRKALAEYLQKIQELAPQAPQGEDEEAEASALASALASVSPARKTRSAVLASGGRIPLLSRDFGESGEIKDRTKTGKSKFVRDQNSANEKINRRIARAMKSAVSDGKFGSQTVPFKGKR